MKNTINTPKEAYDHTMNVIRNLEEQGIEVKIQVPGFIRKSDDPENLDLVEKYNQDNRIHWKLWRNVRFIVKNKEEAMKVSFAKNYLRQNGIYFDYGAGCGGLDWEIDWSFKFDANQGADINEDIEQLFEDFALTGKVTGFELSELIPKEEKQ